MDNVFGPGVVIQLNRDRAGPLIECVGGGIVADGSVGIQSQKRRHRKEFEIVERLLLNTVDNGSALRLDTDPDTRAAQRRSVVRDEGDIGGAWHSDETGCPTA